MLRSVYRRQPIPDAVARLGALQAGVIRRDQAIGCGLSRHAIDRLTRERLWTRLASGIYLSNAGPPNWSSWAWAGVLAGGPSARLGGLAAGWVWRLCDAAPDEIAVWVALDAGIPVIAGPWTFAREGPGVRDPRSMGDPPALRLEDTAVDLASAADGAAVVDWLARAVQTRRTSAPRLAATVRQRSRIRHRQLMLDVLDDLDQGAQSALELKYLRTVERAHGLPRAERQVRRRNTWADALYREFGLLVELDGRLGHLDAGLFRDMRRDNAAAVDGLSTLRFGWADVHGRPCEVAAQVAELLLARGWTGLPIRCQLCRRVPTPSM